jgi:hypothetical protein
LEGLQTLSSIPVPDSCLDCHRPYSLAASSYTSHTSPRTH